MKKQRPISNQNKIELYLHCGLCFDEKPADISPKDYQKIQAGWTKQGIQIWCTRHNVNIIHIDFEGHKHPANTSREVKNK